MKKHLFLAAVISMFHVTSDAQSVETIKKHLASPNSTGLQLGFWEVFNKQAQTLELTGKRPTSRVGFDNWDNLEVSQGVYDFSNVIGSYSRVHNYGETILGAVNISFTTLITPGKQTIPSWYPNNITNPVTRQAAKDFLRAYVQALLTNVGSMVLTIDYEIVSNYRLTLPGSETRAAEWGAWYVEAAAVARQAALDIGMANKLKLQPIVNGNPFVPGNPIFLGPSQNQWLVDVVNASDYLALDTYHSDTAFSNTSAQTTFDIIKFWIDNYAGAKEVIVTENGYNTVTEIYPNITREDRNYKTTGTEADQAIYYQNLFAQLGQANQPTGIFHNKLRSFNIWSIRDNAQKPTTDEDRYFGLIGIDANNNDYYKPAAAIVKTGYAALEADPFHTPYTINNGNNVSGGLLAGTGSVSVTYSNGDNFNFLRYSITNLTSALTYTLKIMTEDTGNVIVHINDKWLYSEHDKNFNLIVTPYCLPNANNTIDVYFTSAKFPFTQTVKQIKLLPGIPTSIQSLEEDVITNEFNLNVPYPNPSENKNLDISFKVSKPGLVKVEILNIQGILVAELYNNHITNLDTQKISWNTQAMAAGLYYVKMNYNNKQQIKKIMIAK